MKISRLALGLVLAALCGFGTVIVGQAPAKVPGNQWPPAMKPQEKSIALSPEDESRRSRCRPGSTSSSSHRSR
jgi:hypothetical protein